MGESGRRDALRVFDMSWYQEQAGTKFDNEYDALEHYIGTGENAGFTPSPVFDPSYYEERYPISCACALLDFCDSGFRECRDPNRYFDSEWYLWQNPAAVAYPHPLLHYLEVGAERNVDTAPCVDMTLLRRSVDEDCSGVRLLHKAITKDYSIDQGVCHSYHELVSRQRGFFDRIRLYIHRSGPAQRRRRLLWVQAGAGSRFFQWYRQQERKWDLLINFYDGSGQDCDIGEYVVAQLGTKFTAIYNVWRNTDFLDGYEQVFFVDDDLGFEFDDIDRYFDLVDSYDLDLSQPSLSKESFCTWPVFLNRSRRGYRSTNGVEIMMPCLSRRALDRMAPFFCLSVSGFGLDLLFAKLASEDGLRVGVVDQVRVQHYSEINQAEGAYYELLRKQGLNSKCELWHLINNNGLERTFYEISRGQSAGEQ